MRVVGAMIGAALVLTGCDAIAGAFPKPAPTPQPCGHVYSAARCQVMTDVVTFYLKTTLEDVVDLVIIPEPTPEVRNGVTILQTRGGAAPIVFQATLADGTTRQVSLCGGIPSGPACFDDPFIETSSVSLSGGYRDVPEGSTPVPSAAPDAVVLATALRIGRLDIPIDRAGPHAVVLGEAWLPNGLVTSADFALVDVWPADVTILDGVVLEIRSMVDGKPIWNVYEHGWREGVEHVEAVLVFDVFRFEPGAKLSIRDVLVR